MPGFKTCLTSAKFFPANVVLYRRQCHIQYYVGADSVCSIVDRFTSYTMQNIHECSAIPQFNHTNASFFFAIQFISWILYHLTQPALVLSFTSNTKISPVRIKLSWVFSPVISPLLRYIRLSSLRQRCKGLITMRSY